MYDGFLSKKRKIFNFHFGPIFVIFWIFVLCHIWLPRYEKTADFLAQMLFGSCIGSHWFQKLKNIQSDTQYLCKIPDIFSVSQPKCLLSLNADSRHKLKKMFHQGTKANYRNSVYALTEELNDTAPNTYAYINNFI